MPTNASTEPVDEPIEDDWTPDLGVTDLGAPTIDEGVLDDGDTD